MYEKINVFILHFDIKFIILKYPRVNPVTDKGTVSNILPMVYLLYFG